MKATGLVILLVLPGSWGTTIPRTYYVSPAGSATYPFSTPETAATVIQDAADAAQHGDLVQLMPGEYAQRVELKDGMSLWGSGADSTTIVALQEAPGGAAVTCAGAADIRRIRFVHEGGALSADPYAIGLSPSGSNVVAQCAFYGLGIDFYYRATGPTLIYDCTFEGPDTGVGLGLEAGMVVDSCRFSEVHVGAAGLLLLRRCTFGGSRLDIGSGDVLLDSCRFVEPRDYGSWIGLQAPCSLRMVNSIVSAKGYVLVVNYANNVEIYNSTFVTELAAIFCDYGSAITLRNSVLWGPPGQLDGVNPASFDVQYCDVAGGWEGEGNIDADPMFVDPDNGDLRLRPGSPCVDAGLAFEELAWIPSTDFTGRPRVMYGGRSDWRRPDMGAYEYYINQLSPGRLPGQTTLTWSCTFEETYSVFYSDDLLTWHVADDSVGPGWNEAVLSWTDDGSLTGVPPLLAPRRFYRVLENP